MQNRSGYVLIVAAVLLLVGYFCFYTVDEREQVVILRFGEVVGEPVKEPGLHFKPPYYQVIYFPKNILAWDGDPGQIPTKDKKYIWVDTFARWRVVDPVKFYVTVQTVENVLNKLDEVINPAVRNVVTSHRLIETVRNSNRSMTSLENEEIQVAMLEGSGGEQVEEGRETLTKKILAEAQPKLDRFGVELIDVKIKRVNYIKKVREAVYKRMIAERKQVAEKIRSIGRGEARKIEGDMERDLATIKSEAFRQAEIIKGKADAEAARIYSDAYSVDSEFYSFMKSLETYRKSFSGARLILSTDADFLGYLKEGTVKREKGQK